MVELVRPQGGVTDIHLVVPKGVLINAHSVDPGVVRIPVPGCEDVLVSLVGFVVVPSGTNQEVLPVQGLVLVERLHGLGHQVHVRNVLRTTEPTEPDLLRLRRMRYKRLHPFGVWSVSHNGYIAVERLYALLEVCCRTEHVIGQGDIQSQPVGQLLVLVVLVHVVVRWEHPVVIVVQDDLGAMLTQVVKDLTDFVVLVNVQVPRDEEHIHSLDVFVVNVRDLLEVRQQEPVRFLLLQPQVGHR